MVMMMMVMMMMMMPMMVPRPWSPSRTSRMKLTKHSHWYSRAGALCAKPGRSNTKCDCHESIVAPPSRPYPGGSAEPMSGKVHVRAFQQINPRVSLPEKMSITKWGRVVCVMENVKDQNLCYIEMVEASKTSGDMRRYLSWLVKTHGTNGTGKPKGKITPAVDLSCISKPFAGNRKLRRMSPPSLAN